ncbi:MAG: mevalonate kinase [Candidatus Aenigmarchaeota archaeon]|nr:mevalonate kinase [Candidatus Aenigmarchaeota archaeon]
MARASAPGKCILTGEHAVVYGEPAIIAAVGRRTAVSVEPLEGFAYSDSRFRGTVRFTVEDAIYAVETARHLWDEGVVTSDFSALFAFIKADGYGNYRKAVVGALAQKFSLEYGADIRITSDIPAGAGLGSSASLAVALTKAMASFQGVKLDLAAINAIAFELEQLIHGTPSGGDNTTACYGGLIWFQKRQHNVIEPLSTPHTLDHFGLVYTGPPEKTTGELVQHVRNLDEAYRSQRVREIGKLVHMMKEALGTKDSRLVKDVINKNQLLLKELGVSIPEIDEIHEAVKRIGGAAKLCGAGGGGIVLCCHEDKAKLAAAVHKLGYELWDAELGAEGVRIES